MSQTATPIDLVDTPSKDALCKKFHGTPLTSLRTPAFVIDRAVFAKNCSRMHERALQWGAEFRAHVKTHKTIEGTRLQLRSQASQTHAVVVSTLMEAWQVQRSGLVADGTVKDILYGLPIGVNKIEDLSTLWDEISLHGAIVRLLVDHPEQIAALEKFEEKRVNPRKWSVFVKVDGGQKRAGVPPRSAYFKSFVKTIIDSRCVSLYGVYCHAGDSYGATSFEQGKTFLSKEVEAANTAAEIVEAIRSESKGGDFQEALILSVGSTPTAHAASEANRIHLQSLLHGKLELHAGNYPMLDLQQLHTGMIQPNQIAQRVVATVVSYYPGRGPNGEDEALCDAGAIAMSKDIGYNPGFGEVIGSAKGWRLGRVSQEHGILTRGTGSGRSSEVSELKIGQQVEIIGQHACLIAAAHPWYYIVDSEEGKGSEVVDVWVPWKGW